MTPHLTILTLIVFMCKFIQRHILRHFAKPHCKFMSLLHILAVLSSSHSRQLFRLLFALRLLFNVPRLLFLRPLQLDGCRSVEESKGEGDEKQEAIV